MIASRGDDNTDGTISIGGMTSQGSMQPTTAFIDNKNGDVFVTYDACFSGSCVKDGSTHQTGDSRGLKIEFPRWPVQEVGATWCSSMIVLKQQEGKGETGSTAKNSMYMFAEAIPNTCKQTLKPKNLYMKGDRPDVCYSQEFEITYFPYSLQHKVNQTYGDRCAPVSRTVASAPRI